MTLQDSIASPTHSTRSTGEVDFARSLIQKMYSANDIQPHPRTGQFNFEHSRWQTNSTYIDRFKYSSTVDISLEPLDRFWVARSISSTMERKVLTTTYHAQPGEVFLLAPLDAPLFAHCSGTEVECVGLDPQLLADLTGDDRPDWLDRPHLGSLSTHQARAWQLVVSHAMDVIATPALHSPLVLTEVQRLLAASFLSLYDPEFDDPPGVDRDGTTRAVDRAIAFIETNPNTNVTVADIARAARISVRSLQSAFRQQRDTTPISYLRRVRLDHAHHDLTAGDPSLTTVTHIATRWGFYDLGAFAKLYRQTYGHSPSQSLRE